jgi:hypothetical protein
MIMLRLALYEILIGQASPSRWARDASESEPLRWLLRGLQPSVRACYRFRDRVADVLQQMHQRVVQDGLDDGLIRKVTTAAQDGTTNRAAASRHRIVNNQTLQKRKKMLQSVLELDAQGLPAPTTGAAWIPPTPVGRAELMRRINQAEGILTDRLKENAKRRKERRLKEKHVCVSLSDPPAAISRDKEKVFCPLYTAQYMVDYESRLILGYDVEARASDVGTLLPMIDRVQTLVGGTLRRVCTDATYCTVIELQGCQKRNIDLIALVQENSLTAKKRAEKASPPPASNRDQFTWLEQQSTYRCPAGHLLDYQWSEKAKRCGGRCVTMQRYHCDARHCQVCSLASQCVRNPKKGRTIKRLEGQELLDAQRERMQHDAAKATLRARGAVVERAIGDIKAHRGGRVLHGRGLSRAKAEIGLYVLAQTILTLHRLRTARANTNSGPT